MALWLVRAGRNGEREEFALDNGVVVIDWRELPDLSGVRSREDVESLISRALPDAKSEAVKSWAVQVFAFAKRIAVGDYVALPLKRRAMVAVGRVTGPYDFRIDNPPGAQHVRPVTWINQEIPRTAIDQDILYSLGAFSTVCQISRNDAESRLVAVANGATVPNATHVGDQALPIADSAEGRDLKSDADDSIRRYIAINFRGHELARLVEAVLKAQSYFTQLSPPGADGGVDVLAGRGDLGLDPPRICVQVKSGEGPVGVKTIRELDGVMSRFGATHGLFVSWDGFRRDVNSENRKEFFRIRLWDSDALIEAVTSCYEKLAAEIQADLPLQRIWTVVEPGSDGH